MLVFDLPDYCKSSTAQNEKLARGRTRERDTGGGDSTGAPDIHAISQLSRILPPSPHTSRRFGVAVMYKAETQSGHSLIWQLREEKTRRDGDREAERGQEILFVNDDSIYSTHILNPFNHPCIWKQIKCFSEIKLNSTKWHSGTILPKCFNV